MHRILLVLLFAVFVMTAGCSEEGDPGRLAGTVIDEPTFTPTPTETPSP
ncbi:MAG: hypothetical protein ACLFP1_04640 [Candidatus Goldiibacteriota bacterium]